MSRDGLFLPAFSEVAPRTMIPVNALVAQFLWSAVLCLSGTYGDLLDYVITTVLIFYIATIVGRWKLARTNPALAPRSLLDRLVPVLYVAATGYVTVALALYKPTYTVPGLVIVALGVPAFFLFRRKKPASA
jgi:APA family basic amino acid/polyamine antiporter